MAGGALAVDTISDDLTIACFDARDANVYPHFAEQSVVLTRLTGPAATAAAVIAALTSDIDLLTLSGHGLADRILGQSGTILEVGLYPAEAVRAKIIHMLACDSGELLGPDLVANGCKAFFGYREQFLFPVANPRDFLDCDGVIDRALAQGLTADEAFQLAIRSFNRTIADLKKAGKTFRASMVQHNRDCLVAPSVDARFGDPTATL